MKKLTLLLAHLRRWIARRRYERELWQTHAGNAFDVGQITDGWRSPELFVITRIKPQIPTALLAGGTAPCHSIRGVPLSKWPITLTIIIATVALAACSAHARIGETEAQIEKRYGKPVHTFSQ